MFLGLGSLGCRRKGKFVNSCAGCCDLTAVAYYADVTRVCNANMDGRDIICIMPTGKSSTPHSIVLSTTTKSINFFPLRWREVAHVPAARDAHTWMHAGCLTSSCAYQGPGSGSTRETRLARSFQVLSLSIALASRLTMQNYS